MRKSQPSRLQSIQALRGVAILLVLLIHAKMYEGFYAGDVLPTVMGGGRAGVDLFFVISGFIMVTITHNKFGKGSKETIKFLGKRIFRIYPLYWFFTFILLPAYFLKPSIFHSTEIGRPVDFFGTLTLYPTGIRPIIWQAWSLTMEVYFYLVFSVILLFKEKLLFKMLSAWSLFVIFGWILQTYVFTSEINPALGLFVDPMTLEFIGGGFIALLLRERQWRGSPILLSLGAFCLVCGAFIKSDPSHSLRILTFGIPSLMILAGAVLCEKGNQFHFNKGLVFIGDISYSVYLTHVMVYASLGRFWPRHWDPSIGKSIIFAILVELAALGFGVLSYRFLEKPLLKQCYKLLPA